jgi:hypothetical protein
LECTFTIEIDKQILQEEFILSFYDLSGSWQENLHLDASYNLANYTLYNNNYSEITGNKSINQDTITLSNGNGGFYLRPIDIDCGTLPFLIPDGVYTRKNLFDTINKLLSLTPETIGSVFSIDKDITRGQDYTKIQWNINKVFTTADYNLVFYDLYSFVSCYYGDPSVRNASSDTTLGSILGFKNLTSYALNSTNIYTNIKSGYTFFFDSLTNTFTENIYTYDTSIPYRCIVSLKGDSIVTISIYKHLILVLDDYNQNHLNDGLVTINPKDNNLSLPSYANRAKYICDPSTNLVLNIGITDMASNNLTQNQIYSINQIIATQNTPKGFTNPGIYVKDVFALIPLKVSGMNPGDTYVELGGTLQNQDRIYFGPVNIHRMSIKLLNDKGEILDLNGADWSVQLICEQLYQSTPSNSLSS